MKVKLIRACAWAYLNYQWNGGALGDRESGLRERFQLLKRLWPALTRQPTDSRLRFALLQMALSFYVLLRWRAFYDYCFSDAVVVEFVDLAHQRDAEPTPPPQLLPPARFVQQSGYVN